MAVELEILEGQKVQLEMSEDFLLPKELFYCPDCGLPLICTNCVYEEIGWTGGYRMVYHLVEHLVEETDHFLEDCKFYDNLTGESTTPIIGVNQYGLTTKKVNADWVLGWLNKNYIFK